MSFLVINLDLL